MLSLKTLAAACCLVCAVGVSARDFVLIVDPGHGGHDAGAVGLHTNEKTINLDVATLLAQKVRDRLNHVKVVMTRDDDTFISLKERADIANSNHGDLFISIHVNSLSKKAKNRKTIAGAQVYTLGLHKSDAALAVAQRENSVMMLESDYSTSYMGFDPESPELNIIFELSQNKHMEQSVELAETIENNLVETAGRVNKGVRQAGFWVLWATSMPSVLVELDFISNPESERYLMSEEGQDELSTAICDAVESYLVTYGPQVLGADAPKSVRRPGKNKPAVEADGQESESPVIYKVQFMVADRLYKDGAKQFKGLTGVEHYVDGASYKYTIGSTTSLDDANKLMEQVQKLFGDAFVIETRNGKRIH